MNNTAFRRLVLDASVVENGVDPPDGKGAPVTLGSRARSSMPMTPRSVAGSFKNEFSRQLAERNVELNQNNGRKFRSSAAPKGTKLAAGYQDRTKLRDAHSDDEKAKRVLALEEMVKLGQMDQATFQQLRDEIVGGDVENVHLVKGLDFKLLKRMRDDADGSRADSQHYVSGAEKLTDADLEDELDKVEAQATIPLEKPEQSKQGVMAPPASRNRDAILKNLRAARNMSAIEKKTFQAPLGSKFKKVGDKREASRIEMDDQGREVLILVDADGNIKRKVKKGTVDAVAASSKVPLPAPNKSVAPLGMEVPESRKLPTPPPTEDLDIFDDVGADFDPLAGIREDGDTDSDSASSADSGEVDRSPGPHASTGSNSKPSTESETTDSKPGRPRNYFGDEARAEANTTALTNPLEDPTIQAALKRAANIQAKGVGSLDAEEDDEKVQKRKRLLETRDRDAEDMDLGFGGSRLGDDDDNDDDKRVKLSVWGEEQSQGQQGARSAKGARKRGPKKKKGDANNMADIMKVIETRKGSKT